MTAFAARVASLTGAAESNIERLAGGDLSEVLLVRREGAPALVAKGGATTGAEAAMLRALAGHGVPTPSLEAEHDGLLLMSHIPNDRLFSARAWSDIGRVVRSLHGHTGARYGWPVNYHLGTVALDNRESSDWPAFWAAQRLLPTAAMLDLPWRSRIDRLCARLPSMLPPTPAPSFLHGDLWTGNILVRDGAVAALVDPACYFGDAEVDLAMLTLFDSPPDEFWEAYGSLAPGWEERRAIYQLFPALVHLRLFGSAYVPLAERLLRALVS